MANLDGQIQGPNDFRRKKQMATNLNDGELNKKGPTIYILRPCDKVNPFII